MRTTGNRSIDFGDDGVMQTLDAMAALVHASIRLPIVVETARRVAADSRGQFGQAQALRRWLVRTWRFVDDPYDVELLVEPEAALRSMQETGYLVGDCDEAATVGAALGAAIGIVPTFTVLGFVDDEGVDRLCHVYASLLTADGPTVDLDVTRPAQGIVPAPTREVTVSIF